MKQILFTGILSVVLVLFTCVGARTQGTLYISNLDNRSLFGFPVGADRSFANSFRTGSNEGGYIFSSVDLLMLSASGSPEGFSVSIYDAKDTLPGINIGNLVGPDPASGGVFNYTTSGILLSPSTDYFVAVTSDTPLETGAYNWSLPRSVAFESIDDWSLGPYIAEGTETAWELERITPGGGLQFAVYATAIPEPATLALLTCGGLFFAAHLRRSAKKKSSC